MKHLPLFILIAICIYLATMQLQPEPDYRYVYVTEDGWKCTMTIHTDECEPIDVGGSR